MTDFLNCAFERVGQPSYCGAHHSRIVHKVSRRLFLLAASTALASNLVMAGTLQAAFAQSVSSTGDVRPTQPPDASTSWNVGGALYVGDNDHGELIIEDGGVVTNTIGFVGQNAGSDGNVTVRGEGSTWDNASSLYVGYIGRGTLTIEDGGTVTNTIGFVGQNAGSDGNVTVTGAGSTWTSASDLYVGYIGNGALTIEEGGTVKSVATVLANVAGTATLNLTGTEGARGVLETGYVEKGGGAANFTFDGGILRASNADEVDFLQNFNAADVTIAAGGAFLDTNGFNKGVGVELSGSGSLTKLGDGTLTLSGVSSYSGGTVINAGSVEALVTGALGTWQVSVNATDAHLSFRNEASAGDLAIKNWGLINFYDQASAGDATISSYRGGISFNGNSTAGNASITVVDSATLDFYGNASAGNALIDNGDGSDVRVRFHGADTAYGTTIINHGLGQLEISGLTSDGIAIGSLSGDGAVDLGSKALTLGGLGKNDAIGGVISGSGGSLTKTGPGMLTLTGANSYSGATTVGAGTLQVGNGGAGGSIVGDVAIAADATLAFNRSDSLAYGGQISGAGAVAKQGEGVLTLSGDSGGFGGATTVGAGTLAVDGVLGGRLTVGSGARLAGSGTVGATTAADGGTIAPGASLGTLTVDGALTLSAGALLDYELGSPGPAGNAGSGNSDRIAVAGDLSLDGTLNLAQSGSPADGTAGFGYYRLMTYGGTLTDSGLEIGDTPPLSEPGDFEIQAGGGNVDLFIAAVGDDRLQHWQGGNGIWDTSNPQWLNQGGAAPVTWAGHHAVFKNEPGGFDGGTISVEGTQSFKGLQFVDDGYVLTGDGALQTDANGSEIRVLADSATIATRITGSGGIVKTEAGTLILSGANSYTGGTMIADGTLQVAADA